MGHRTAAEPERLLNLSSLSRTQRACSYQRIGYDPRFVAPDSYSQRNAYGISQALVLHIVSVALVGIAFLIAMFSYRDSERPPSLSSRIRSTDRSVSRLRVPLYDPRRLPGHPVNPRHDDRGSGLPSPPSKGLLVHSRSFSPARAGLLAHDGLPPPSRAHQAPCPPTLIRRA